MALSVGDIVFARGGKPSVVVGYDEKTEKANLEESMALAQEIGRNGIRNGVSLESRDAYNSVIEGVRNRNKKQEIEDLYTRIQEMKKAGADARLMRYLEGELQYRMSREDYQPVQVSVPEHAIGL
jgi:hypothetical protein